jgi:aspartyl-tRNA(Asn)/glutamyl-tRNA(Gln) amidotransferase subunit A
MHSPDAVTIARLVASRALSARDATQAALASIERLDAGLFAFCALDRDRALADAAAIDLRLARGEGVGPLAGVPVAVKDLISTRGMRTTFGSPLYAEHVPLEDDIAVERLRRADAIIVGKTNTSEFGYGAVGHNQLFPTTRNPWNRTRTPGGSSAGSAAAIASGMLPLALGSDGGGSVRIPAALSGIFGIKPSWGRIPVYPGCRDERLPGASGWESLEHIGPMTRTVADAALALSVLCGPSPKDRHSVPLEPIDWRDLGAAPLRGLRVAFTPDCGFAAVEPEVAAVAEELARVFATELGCTLASDAPLIGDTQPVFEALVALDTDRSGLRALALEQGHAFRGQLSRLLAREWTADDFTDAILARKRIANTMSRFMESYDFLLTPTVSVTAFDLDVEGPERIAGREVESSAWTPFSALANLTGQPAASVPAGFTRDGHPVGLQIVGRHLDDIGVLRAAAALEAARPWCDVWPEDPATP